ncbi:hypothetical protein NJLHNGOC_02975 [Novacetimonas cocois]|uniref:Uncharacterized protein n=2 Tax=Novacetimonas cocois TaxID=1747507 RepID=A0A365Z0G8_9PROT|nr:hypothetical protein NJLHNGOC_02975 [Novacetimonas cocois]
MSCRIHRVPDAGRGKVMGRIIVAVSAVLLLCMVGGFLSLGVFPPALVQQDVHRELSMATPPAAPPAALATPAALPVVPMAKPAAAQ